MRKTIMSVIVLTLMSPWSSAQEPTLRVKELMTSEQITRTGVNKLSDEEVLELDRWFTAMMLRSVTARGGGVDSVAQFEGCRIFGSDGEPLGLISRSPVSTDSLASAVGRYGSTISSTSIFNTIGKYGSTISSQSAFNTIASSPPEILCGGQFSAYLTVNTIKSPRLDPRTLRAWLGR